MDRREERDPRGYRVGERVNNGGSVPGHAPTSGGNVAHFGDKASEGFKSKPILDEAMRRSRMAHQAKKDARAAMRRERECLEAIQNGGQEEVLVRQKRYPPGLVARLMALHRASEGGTKDMIQAQRLVREILFGVAPWKANPALFEDPEALEEKKGDTITVIHGRLEVAMPGSADQPAPEEGGEPAGAEGR